LKGKTHLKGWEISGARKFRRITGGQKRMVFGTKKEDGDLPRKKKRQKSHALKKECLNCARQEQLKSSPSESKERERAQAG